MLLPWKGSELSGRHAAQGPAAGSSAEGHGPERHRGQSLEAGQPDRPGRLWFDLSR